MSDSINSIIRKITTAQKNTFIIFFTYGCHYSEKALELLRNNKLPYKGYDINKINGRLPHLLDIFNNIKYKKIISFDSNHTTKPIIFLNGKFLGGMSELAKYLEST